MFPTFIVELIHNPGKIIQSSGPNTFSISLLLLKMYKKSVNGVYFSGTLRHPFDSVTVNYISKSDFYIPN